eukprot:scaffold120319_cov37-Phaeocystis_antarctica.AAC.2
MVWATRRSRHLRLALRTLAATHAREARRPRLRAHALWVGPDAKPNLNPDPDPLTSILTLSSILTPILTLTPTLTLTPDPDPDPDPDPAPAPAPTLTLTLTRWDATLDGVRYVQATYPKP